MAAAADVELRTELRPGDLGDLVALHGRLYAEEYGWNERFEAYVADGLARFVLRRDPATDRIWLAERDGELVGSVAVVAEGGDEAMIRWFLLHPDARGAGLGRRLLNEALAFCREHGFRSVHLWTAKDLTTAQHLYRSVGFRLTEEHEGAGWGRPVTEMRFDLTPDAERR